MDYITIPGQFEGLPEREGAALSVPEEYANVRRHTQPRADWQSVTEYITSNNWAVLPPERLQKAAQNHFTAYGEKLKAALADIGADDDTKEAVLFDYMAALLGSFDYTATPPQMDYFINNFSSLRAFALDSVVLDTLYLRYAESLAALNEYCEKVKREPSPERRTAFFSGGYGNGAPFFWLLNNGVTEIADFAGCSTQTIKAFLDALPIAAAAAWYIDFYYFAKYALLATPEELAEIMAPGNAEPTEEGRRSAEDLAELREAARREREERFKTEGEAVEISETGAHIPLPENYALALSRDIWGSRKKSGEDMQPISAFITEYIREKNVTTISPYIIEKAVNGVVFLFKLKRPRLVGKYYELNTNISEFATLCGLREFGPDGRPIGQKDVNEAEKNALLTALFVLHNLFVIVWRPEGRTAVNLFNVQSVGLEGKGKDKITINVSAEGWRGRPVLISPEEWKEFIKDAKGAAKRHFVFQILSKGHKDFDALQSEIFGYDTMLREAQLSSDADYKAAKEYVRKNKARDRKRLLSWFSKEAEKGTISYKIKKNKAGKTIASWRRLMKPTEAERAAAEEPKKAAKKTGGS